MKASALTDDAFLKAFEACDFTAKEWTHEAHIRMAFLYLKDHPFASALSLVRTGINRLNAVIGVRKRGYHETITIAFLLLVHHRMQNLSECPWPTFRTIHGDLLSPKILENHYTEERLNLNEAKTQFLAPDLKPFSFSLPDGVAFFKTR